MAEWTEGIKTKVIGVSHKDPASGQNRQDVIKKHLKPGTDLVAKLEPNNPADPNAIAIWYEKPGRLFGKTGYHLGYLTEERAAEFAPQMRKGARLQVDVLALTGGTKDKPTIGVNIVIRVLK